MSFETSQVVSSLINANSFLESKLRELKLRNDELEKKIQKYELKSFKTDYFSAETRTRQRIFKNIKDIITNLNEDLNRTNLDLTIKYVQIVKKMDMILLQIRISLIYLKQRKFQYKKFFISKISYLLVIKSMQLLEAIFK